MSIQNSIIRACKQTAVYWGNPQNDGYGGKTYDPPIELLPPLNGVRWEDRNETFLGNTGNNMVARSIVYTLQDVDQEGILFLGTLDDLDSAEIDNSMLIEDAHTIKRFDRVPKLGSSDEYVRKSYLTSKNMQ